MILLITFILLFMFAWCTVQPPAEMEGQRAVRFGPPPVGEPVRGGGQPERSRVRNTSQVKVRRGDTSF